MSTINKGICYIVGASKETSGPISFIPKTEDMVIAADGGYDTLKEQNIPVDILIGDFDSIDVIPSDINIIRHPVRKDDTDTFLSYRTGFEKGYRNFVIFGGIGGRIDHTIANIQTLANIAENGGRGFLVGEGSVITVICNDKISFPQDCCGTAGIFAQGKIANNVTVTGMKYCTDNISLNPYIPLGVSNEFTKETASVSVGDGVLLIIWYETAEKFLTHIESLLRPYQ